eukprot:jgi/Psemu1/290925/fgenesh1_pg.588_\
MLVVEKQQAGELPLFLCDEVNRSLNQLLVRTPDESLDEPTVPSEEYDSIIDKDALLAAALGDVSSLSNEPMHYSILEGRCHEKFPSPMFGEIDDATINAIADSFLRKMENAVQKLLCEEYCPERDAWGLYVDWFDEKKITTAIRLFPRILWKKWNGAYPINWQTWKLQDFFDGTISFSLNSLSLIPMLAKLRIELDCRFEQEEEKTDNERGGLFSKDLDGVNVLQNLCIYPWVHLQEKDQLLCDHTIARIMETLRTANLFQKEDVREHDLVGKLFCLTSSDHVFPEQRFRFLSDWDPMTLARPIGSFPTNGCKLSSKSTRLPIHGSIECSRDIRAFSIVFEAGFRHFPEKIGFVFTKDSCGSSNEDDHHNGRGQRSLPVYVPYARACEKYGSERVKLEVLNQIATNYSKIAPEDILLTALADDTMDWMGLHILVQNFPEALSQIATNNRAQATSPLWLGPMQMA